MAHERPNNSPGEKEPAPRGAYAHPGHHATSAAPSAVIVELREHVPFSVAAVAIGLMVAGIICLLGLAGTGPEVIGAAGGDGHDHAAVHDRARAFFHLFHPAHMLFSAAATTAMFCRYENKLVKAVVVGLIGAVGVCGISDVAIPHVSLLVLKVTAPWHICVIEHPDLVLPFAAIGVLVGMSASGGVMQSTVVSHSLHVLVSTMASIFYMVGPMGIVAWIDDIGKVFIFIVVAVMVPCCLSDIVFPTLMSPSARHRYEHEPHVH